MTQTMIEQLGGEAAVAELVHHFYDLMETRPEAAAIHRLHFRGHGLDHARQTQFEFLSGFLGGRPYYRERFGHMNLREIHAHVPIRTKDAEMWLDAMDVALQRCNMAGPTVENMRAVLRRAALKLVNDVPDWREDAP